MASRYRNRNASAMRTARPCFGRATDHPSGGCSATNEGVIDHQNDDGAYERNQHAIYVDAIDTGFAQRVKNPSADDRAYYSQQDVAHEALAFLVDHLAGQKTGNQT